MEGFSRNLVVRRTPLGKFGVYVRLSEITQSASGKNRTLTRYYRESALYATQEEARAYLAKLSK